MTDLICSMSRKSFEDHCFFISVYVVLDLVNIYFTRSTVCKNHCSASMALAVKFHPRHNFLDVISFWNPIIITTVVVVLIMIIW